MHRKTSLLAAVAAAAISLGTVAQASGDARVSPDTRTQITEKLTAEGYEVRKIDVEDGMIEVYALKDGKRYELYLDNALNISRVNEGD